jgi:transposase
LKNRIHAYLAELNLRVETSDLYGKAGRQWLRAVELPEETRLQVDLLLELVGELDERAKRLDARIRKQVEVAAEAQRLMTVPGIGSFTALPDASTFPCDGLGLSCSHVLRKAAAASGLGRWRGR